MTTCEGGDCVSERDKAIDNRATRNAYSVLFYSTTMALFVGLFAVVFMETPLQVRFNFVALATQLVLLCLVLAETVRYLTIVYSYRRGA